MVAIEIPKSGIAVLVHMNAPAVTQDGYSHINHQKWNSTKYNPPLEPTAESSAENKD